MGKRNRNTFQKRNPDSGYLPLTIEVIKEQERKVQEDSKYGKNGNGMLLSKYFSNNPTNEDYYTVVNKILLIDYTNSTQLQKHKEKFTVFSLAKKIMDIPDLDKRIANGDPTVVDDIAGLTEVNLFSFASKFCFYHNKKEYSIYDGVVVDTIPQYMDVTKSYIRECKNDRKNSKKNDKDKKSYKDYINIINKLIDIYDLNSEQDPEIRKKLDHFLWYSNKEEYHKNKKSSKSSKNK